MSQTVNHQIKNWNHILRLNYIVKTHVLTNYGCKTQGGEGKKCTTKGPVFNTHMADVLILD